MSHPPERCFAIVPAAGKSRRMGQPKLMLPFKDGKLIDGVLGAWTASVVCQVVVVVRQNDHDLRRACQRWPVTVVCPAVDPVDMKQSIQFGLREIEAQFQPTERDQCFIAPADLPGLSADLIDRVVATPNPHRQIVVPKFGDRRSHPVLMPWAITGEIFQLADDQGVNHLISRHDTRTADFPASDALDDVDDREDYVKVLRELDAGK